MKVSQRNVTLLLSNILLPVSIYIFATNFLQPNALLGSSVDGKNQYVDFRNMTGPSPFTKVVFLVVDALRSDYVYSAESELRFTQSLIRSGAAMPYTARTSTPSMTRSCIKALALGSVPPLADSANNLQESSEVADADTWLSRMKAEERGKVVLIGESMWAHLFPHAFDRSHPTITTFDPNHEEADSFAISAIQDEIKRDDWSALVIQFSGLDMMSHRWSATGTHFRSKQRQIDAMIRDLYSAIEQQEHLNSTLFVLTGDHGTNDDGCHGGYNEDETSPALVFISSRLRAINTGYESPTEPKTGAFGYYTSVDQIDIVPTLTSLLGFPIPVDSQGSFITDFLPLWGGTEQQIWLLLQNTVQLIRKHAHDLSIPLHQLNPDGLRNTEIAELGSLRQQLQEWLEHGLPQGVQLPMNQVQEHSRRVILTAKANYLPFPWLLGGIAACAGAVVFGLLNVIHASLMFSRGGVEGEHRFWYLASQAWLVYLVLTRSRNSSLAGALASVATLSLQLLAQEWNTRGESSFIERNVIRTPWALWTLVGLTYTASGVELSKSLIRRRPRTSIHVACVRVFAAAISLGAFLFKLGCQVQGHPEQFTDLSASMISTLVWCGAPGVARCVYLSVLFGVLYATLSTLGRTAKGTIGIRTNRMAGILELLSIYLITQSNARNIPMFLNFRFQLTLLSSSVSDLNPIQAAITTIVMSSTAYFALGGTNSLGSLRAANSFNGMHAYHDSLAALQTFFSNMAGPIWWACHSIRLLKKRRTSFNVQKMRNVPSTHSFVYFFAAYTAFTSISMLAVMAACVCHTSEVMLREIMVPKLVFASLWCIPFHAVIVGLLCGGLWWINIDI